MTSIKMPMPSTDNASRAVNSSRNTQTRLTVPPKQIVAWQEALLDLAVMTQNIHSAWEAKADKVGTKIITIASDYIVPKDKAQMATMTRPQI